MREVVTPESRLGVKHAVSATAELLRLCHRQSTDHCIAAKRRDGVKIRRTQTEQNESAFGRIATCGPGEITSVIEAGLNDPKP